jgi:hypothetical protein
MKKPPVLVAQDILKTKYPDAELAFVAGSFNRGEETAFSDIDLVVVFSKLEHAWRESFTFDGWPVEAFVHDPETLEYFMVDFDMKSGAASLACMILEGPPVPETHPLVAKLREKAARVLADGPSAWDEEKIDARRYVITDLIEDLRDPRTSAEACAIVAKLHEQLGDFYLRTNRFWSASGKQIPRQISKHDPDLGQRWNEAFVTAYKGDTGALINLTEAVLQPFGGFLFNGYRLDAPADWRIAMDS